jgi:hypothetical protein
MTKRHLLSVLILISSFGCLVSPLSAQYWVHDAGANKLLAFLQADQKEQLAQVLQHVGLAGEHLETTKKMMDIQGMVTEATAQLDQFMEQSGINKLMEFAKAGQKTFNQWSSLEIPSSSLMKTFSTDMLGQLFGQSSGVLGSLTRGRFESLLGSFGMSSSGRSASAQELISSLLKTVPRDQLITKQAELRSLAAEAVYEDRRAADHSRASQIAALQEANTRLANEAGTKSETVAAQNAAMIAQNNVTNSTLTTIAENLEGAAISQEMLMNEQKEIMKAEAERRRVESIVNSVGNYEGF